MHSSFPRKEELDMYKPKARNSLRHWAIRAIKQVQSNPRLTAAGILAFFVLTVLFWGRTATPNVSHVQMPVVLVAVLERYDALGDEVRIIDKILENRYEYAMAHGTGVFA
jgi:hypothetical protein